MPDWGAFVRDRLGSLRVRPERESEIVAELAQELEDVYREALGEGAGEGEALQRAELHLGDWEGLAAAIEAAERPAPPPPQNSAGIWTGLWHDVRYALRFLRRNPTFTVIAVATLAFGIGGNTAIFTMVDTLLLRDLPYRDPDRLMAIETRRSDQPEIEPWTSAPDFFDFRERQHSFSATAALSPVWNVVLTGRGPAEQLDALYCSAEFFPMLGVNAAVGRTFSADEDQRGRPKGVAVLSHSFWQRRFAGNAGIVGQTLRLDGGVYTVIGVTPAGFRWAGDPLNGTDTEIDIWLPMATNPIVNSLRTVRFLKVIGKRRPEITESRARDEIRRISTALAAEYPQFNKGYAADGRPLREQITSGFRVSMMLLLGAVGFVLLMVCANVANLLLARAATRQREITVRIAVGAGAWRLARQLLTEGLVLSAIGGVIGIPLAYAGLRALIAAGPETMIHGSEIRLDLRALLFTMFAVLLCAILAGLPPALRVVRSQVGNSLRESGRGLIGGQHRLRGVLVVVQVAAALTLLVGAGLLVRSFQHVLGVSPGFDAHNLATIATQMPSSAQTPDRRRAVYTAIRDSLLATPGVVDVGAVSRLPFRGKNLGSWVYTEGHDTPGTPGVEVEYRVATASYFSTMGIRLREGRLYDGRDDANPAAAVVINHAMAQRLWPGESAIGRRIKISSTPERAPWTTVIGVVQDIRHFGLEVDPRPELYRPYSINPLGAPILVIRTRTDPSGMLRDLSARVRSVDAEIPTYSEFAMESLIAKSTVQRRFMMLLLAGFAAGAMLLAGLGIYGTVSQVVAQRTPEIGVRIALGATPREVAGLVLGEGARLMVAGAIVGLLASAGMAWAMRAMLFEIGPLDPWAFISAAAVLCCFTLAACWVPARRASRVDPITALREV